MNSVEIRKSPDFKVVRIISGLWPGGVEKKLSVLLPVLKKQGLDISIICLREEGELASVLRQNGIPVILSKMPSRWSPKGIWNLRKLLKKMNVDIVHTHMYRSNISGTISAAFAQIPVIINNIHNVDSWDDRGQMRTDKFVSKLRDCTVFVSKGVADDYLKQIPNIRDKYRVIYNGVDVDYFSPGSPKNSLGEGIVVGSAARLMPQKGLDFIVRASSEAEFQKRNVMFYIAGDGPLRETLNKQAIDLGAEKHFKILGFLDDIREFYRAIDIFAMPSHKEGFSNALVEAMACGIAPVATAVGGNSEAVQDGLNGLIINADSYQEFRDALSKLITREQLLKDMSKQARIAAKSFSLEVMAEQTMDMYLTLLSQKGK